MTYLLGGQSRKQYDSSKRSSLWRNTVKVSQAWQCRNDRYRCFLCVTPINFLLTQLFSSVGLIMHDKYGRGNPPELNTTWKILIRISFTCNWLLGAQYRWGFLWEGVAVNIWHFFIHPLSYFSFQPLLHDWCNKGCGMCYPVCGMVHIKEPLLLIGKSSLCAGSGFPFSLSEWSLTICLRPYNCR